MYIRNNTVAVIFRVIFIIICGAGLVIRVIGSGFGPDAVMKDFALVANALSLVYFAYLIIVRTDRERGVLRGAVTIYMIITFIIYYYVNFGISGALSGDLSLGGTLLYFVSPVMVFADYLFFCRKGSFTAYSPIIWMIIPVIFNLAVFIINSVGAAVKPVPYFNLLGMNMMITLLVFLGISYLLFVADNLMAGRRR